MKRLREEAAAFVAAGSDDDASEAADSLPSSDGEPPAAEEAASGSGEDVGVSDDEYDLRDESDGEPGTQQRAGGGTDASESEGKGGTVARGPRKGGGAAPGSMASAFQEILAHPGPVSKKEAAPILLGSKSLAKRKAEEETETETQRAAKRLRREMKQRGHTTVPRKGEDPEHDAREKAFLRTATKGVVQLFNAVSKAQSQQKEAAAAGVKPKDAKISKSSFFAELKGELARAQAPVGPEPGGRRRAGARGSKAAEEDGEEPGWDVLKEDFAGLQGSSGTKMKDWDKAAAPDSPPEETLAGALSDSDSEGGLGEW